MSDGQNTTGNKFNIEGRGTYPVFTKRDYFAAMAMQGIISNPEEMGASFQSTIKISVKYADALIAELDKEGITAKQQEMIDRQRDLS